MIKKNSLKYFNWFEKIWTGLKTIQTKNKIKPQHMFPEPHG